MRRECRRNLRCGTHISGSFGPSELISNAPARKPAFPPLWASVQRSDVKCRGSKLITNVSEASSFITRNSRRGCEHRLYSLMVWQVGGCLTTLPMFPCYAHGCGTCQVSRLLSFRAACFTCRFIISSLPLRRIGYDRFSVAQMFTRELKQISAPTCRIVTSLTTR